MSLLKYIWLVIATTLNLTIVISLIVAIISIKGMDAISTTEDTILLSMLVLGMLFLLGFTCFMWVVCTKEYEEKDHSNILDA